MQGIVFDIQHYAVYDGPGIRTTVFLKGCPLRCLWCHNPESQALHPQIGYLQERCQLCGRCVEACPQNALHLTQSRVIRDYDRCLVCGACARACPNRVQELIGKTMSVADVVEIVARDKPFYDNSGGGVTLSGGEPTAQADFLLELLRALQTHHIHTALETCGYFRPALVDPLTGCVDLFLFDVKHVDPDAHRQYTGVSNESILANFSAILARAGSERILPRVPVIPGLNANFDGIDGIAAFLHQAGYTGPVHLMPYNRMAKTKYEKLGKGSAYTDMGKLTEELLHTIIHRFEYHAFPVVCNH
jgi:pyruvate formate lyase activating enzyme